MKREIIYYDGHCGFCHRWIKFVIFKDRNNHFDFAPRESQHFKSEVPDEVQATLPRSILVSLESGAILTRSTASLYILKKLGGFYSFISWLGSLFPVFLRDCVYKLIAKIRHKLYAKPKDLCPLVPEEYVNRFKK